MLLLKQDLGGEAWNKQMWLFCVLVLYIAFKAVKMGIPSFLHPVSHIFSHCKINVTIKVIPIHTEEARWH